MITDNSNSQFINKIHHKKEDLFFNARLKFYGDEKNPDQLLISSSPLFNPHSAEDSDKWETYIYSPKAEKEQTEKDPSKPNRQSFLRAKQRAYDYVRCNNFTAFLTLTFDGDIIERDNYDEIIKKLNIWLDNRVRRNGLYYILCPEYHKNGAIHFHGLCNFESLKLTEAVNPHNGRKLRDHGVQIYNISDFPLGFTTVMPVTGEDASKACAGYVFKYMTKQGLNNKIGGRYFLAGGNLRKPEYVYFNLDYDCVDAYEIPLIGSGDSMKVLRGEPLKNFIQNSI